MSWERERQSDISQLSILLRGNEIQWKICRMSSFIKDYMKEVALEISPATVPSPFSLHLVSKGEQNRSKPESRVFCTLVIQTLTTQLYITGIHTQVGAQPQITLQ